MRGGRYPDGFPGGSMTHRRDFLRFMAGSPLLAAWGPPLSLLEEAATSLGMRPATVRSGSQGTATITSPDEALSIMDFEAAARAALPPAHFGYMAGGVDDDATLRANRDGYGRWVMRARRMVDVSVVDTSVTLFGTKWETPIFLCPAGSQKAFHPDGEIATARAARAKNHLQVLSTVTTSSVEDVNAARGTPVWYQLYPTNDVTVGLAIAKRAQTAGCPVLVLTVDNNGGRNSETQARMTRFDRRDCSSCHVPGLPGAFRRKPMFDGLDLSKVTDLVEPRMDWGYIARLRDGVPGMRLVIKGIVTREDAALAVRHGADGIVVSNHGGRGEESGRASVESLSEVVDAVNGRIPVMLDGGIRRGTDVFKALALGARAVGIGRPYLWGLSAFGQPGVEAVLSMLRGELELAMRTAGVTSVQRITRSFVARA